MVDRVSSDNPAVRTVRVTLRETPTGITVSVPATDAAAVPAETVIRIVLDETVRFARPRRAHRGDGVAIPAVHGTSARARESTADEHLADWVASHDVRPGGSAHLDVIEPDFAYGLREPGQTVTYDGLERPDESLASIAAALEDESN